MNLSRMSCLTACVALSLVIQAFLGFDPEPGTEGSPA